MDFSKINDQAFVKNLIIHFGSFFHGLILFMIYVNLKIIDYYKLSSIRYCDPNKRLDSEMR